VFSDKVKKIKPMQVSRISTPIAGKIKSMSLPRTGNFSTAGRKRSAADLNNPA
jgi:hypothetical protein